MLLRKARGSERAQPRGAEEQHVRQAAHKLASFREEVNEWPLERLQPLHAQVNAQMLVRQTRRLFQRLHQHRRLRALLHSHPSTLLRRRDLPPPTLFIGCACAARGVRRMRRMRCMRWRIPQVLRVERPAHTEARGD